MEISNQYLTTRFNLKGAELTSLKKGEQEYLWQADPEHWGRHAPVLFPIVGKLKENTYEFGGKSYSMGQHGFARDQQFSVVSHDQDTITFLLKESGETLKNYPFKFELIITYKLTGASLETYYEVNNTDHKEMIFSIGAHPAFNCPMNASEQRSDYWLTFDRAESFDTHRLSEDGLFSGETEKVAEGNDIRITSTLFNKDALVFKNLKSKTVSISSPKGKWLTFSFDGFPYLGIWSKSSESPFVCIEPWFGLADHVRHNQKLQEKEGIRLLSPGENFSCSFRVDIH